jgi:hypothetical protein
LRKNAKKIIYDFDDAVMYKASNPDAENTSHMRLFERTAKLSDSIIASNEYLAAYARRFNSNVHIIPTGLVVDDYKISAAKPNDGKIRLVWMGSSATLGYLEQLKEPLEETGKLFDNVVLRIVCDRFPALSNIAVEQRKWSVETQVADLVTSDIGLAPLPDNRFTRGKCAYKILQYMAAGLPTIASPVGANQEYIEKSNAGLLAVDKDQWLDSITTLIKDEKLRTQMAGNANDFVGQFDRAVFVEKFSSAVKDCVNKS